MFGDEGGSGLAIRNFFIGISIVLAFVMFFQMVSGMTNFDISQMLMSYVSSSASKLVSKGIESLVGLI